MCLCGECHNPSRRVQTGSGKDRFQVSTDLIIMIGKLCSDYLVCTVLVLVFVYIYVYVPGANLQGVRGRRGVLLKMFISCPTPKSNTEEFARGFDA